MLKPPWCWGCMGGTVCDSEWVMCCLKLCRIPLQSHLRICQARLPRTSRLDGQLPHLACWIAGAEDHRQMWVHPVTCTPKPWISEVPKRNMNLTEPQDTESCECETSMCTYRLQTLLLHLVIELPKRLHFLLQSLVVCCSLRKPC